MQKSARQYRNKNRDTFTASDISDDYVYDLKKGVVLYVIRQSLLESGKERFESVHRSLFEKYRCELSDCFEKPEYLVDVLKYVYDDSYTAIVETMKRGLNKFAQEGTIKEFLEKISR